MQDRLFAKKSQQERCLSSFSPVIMWILFPTGENHPIGMFGDYIAKLVGLFTDESSGGHNKFRLVDKAIMSESER